MNIITKKTAFLWKKEETSFPKKQKRLKIKSLPKAIREIVFPYERSVIYKIAKLISNPYINKYKMQILIKIANE